MNELEKMCQEMDEIAKKYNFLYIAEIKLKSFCENPINKNTELTSIEYNRIA